MGHVTHKLGHCRRSAGTQHHLDMAALLNDPQYALQLLKLLPFYISRILYSQPDPGIAVCYGPDIGFAHQITD